MLETRSGLALLPLALLLFAPGCGEQPAADGERSEDPCEDVVCEQPPANRCQDENLLRVFASPGTCAEGECLYDHEDLACEHGCDPEAAECLPCSDECAAGEAECVDGSLRECVEGDLGCLVWTDFAPCEEGVCADGRFCGTCDEQPCGVDDGCCPWGCWHEDDADCSPPTADELTTWVLQVSDLHFGDTATVSADFTYFLDVVVPTVSAPTVINTGDAVDLGSSVPAWEDYFAIADVRAPPVPHYFEIPGNHDVKETGVPNYLAFTLAGLAGLGLYGQTFVDGTMDPNLGRLRVVRANTADSGLNALNVPGIFTQEQADDLMALSPGDEPISYTLLAAHHPLTGIQRLFTGIGRMRDLVADVGAVAYLCGHAHIPRLSWYEDTLVVQAASLGKSSPPGFAVVSLDVSGPSAKMIELTPRVPWPVVLIASPADPDLAGSNPYAVSFSPASELDVRAIAFDPAGISAVEARLDGGSWSAMTVSEGGVWSTALPLSESAADQSLEVRALGGSGTESQSMRVVVAAP